MKFLQLALFILLTHTISFAEEGMLIPSVIQAFESDMKAKGMKLTAQDIYDVNNSSLKDAVLHFGGGCTAELVSDKGLLLTNHHCGYSQIQSHSSLEKDYLKNGFWAKNYAEELLNPGLFVARMVRIDDVTETVNFGVRHDMSNEDKVAKMKANMIVLIEDAEKGNGFKAEIKAFNYGNDFYIIVKEIFNDVRLVGTPPNSIGKFGGDTDNWVWPRHTGDFSVFRVYSGIDNKPADFSESNVPYTPLHFLPIAMTPRKMGDFTMVYGFPGTTEQHLVSSQIKYIMDKERPARIGMREKSLSVIDAGMRSSDQIRIQYSAKQARIANAYKKWIGQVGGLTELGAVRVKEEYETKYNEMAQTKPEWAAKYGSLVSEMKENMAKGEQYDFAYAMAVEYIFIGPEMLRLARNFSDIMENYDKLVETGKLEEEIENLNKGLDGFFKNYDVGIDRQIFELLTDEYLKQMNEIGLPNILTTTSASALTKSIYNKSFLVDIEDAKNALKKVNKRVIKKWGRDPGMMLFRQLMEKFEVETIPGVREFHGRMDGILKVYVEGKQEMFPDAKHWADANGTMRITYGQLEGSAPNDGMEYADHTTTAGILQKYATGNPDFDLLPDLIETYKKKDFGPYAQDGELWVCFTGSNHTTGGNSGSPVIDANGNLMGLNFDRSWESTMSDYMFDPNRCRNITVDIRYVLWVMDKYAGATHLVKEMKLVN
ncbi:S46 family peptidase [Crocinitomicaceae bacterium]|nr:S46 family peptidase [Crocinitomicaceae bacterium]